MTFGELRPGLLIDMMSKSEPGAKYFLCIGINWNYRVVKLMYISTHRPKARRRCKLVIRSDRLPMKVSETGLSDFGFEDFARYTDTEFSSAFRKDYGPIPLDVRDDLKSFCEAHRNEIISEDYKHCMAAFELMVTSPLRSR